MAMGQSALLELLDALEGRVSRVKKVAGFWRVKRWGSLGSLGPGGYYGRREPL